MQKNHNVILDNENERYCEIYKITNKMNGKCYIGQAVEFIESLKERLAKHLDAGNSLESLTTTS